MTKSRGIVPYMSRRLWVTSEDQLMVELYPHVETEVVAWFLNRTVWMVNNRATKLRLHKTREMVADTARDRCLRPDHGGIATRFKKGQISHNKGKKGVCAPGCEKTWFKKGHQRSDTAPVGAERIEPKDGYVQVKVADKGDYALPWRQKHRLVWEQHNGPIPKGHVVAFKDRNKLNCDIGNLVLLTFVENMKRNSIHNLPPELKHTVQVLGQLKRRINERDSRQREQPADPARAPVRHAEGPAQPGQADGSRSRQGGRRSGADHRE